MIGRTYLERGKPVVVLAKWGMPHVQVGAQTFERFANVGVGNPNRGAPRNVLIRRGDGVLVVRPFRGLRRVK